MARLMKGIGIGVGGLVVLSGLAVAVGPSLLPDSVIADRVAAASRDATGRAVSIAGGSALSLLPSPSVTLRDVRFPGIESGTADLARIARIEARVGWSVVFGGPVRIESLRLVSPRISLERLADGRANWQFTTPAGGGGDDGSGPGPALDRLVIEDGTVTYADAVAGRRHRLDGFAATASAADLAAGPYALDGQGRLDDSALRLKLESGRLGAGTPAPVTVEARLGGLDARAEATVALAPALSVTGAVKLGVVDLEALPKGLTATDGAAESGEPTPFALPADMRIALDLSLEAIRAHGQTSGPMSARLELADGRLRVPALSLAAPGGGAITAEASLTAADGAPRAEWRLEAAPEAPRALLRWLGLETTTLPSDALRKMHLAASGTAGATALRLDALALSVDESRLEGTASLELAARPRITARLTLDDIDLDRYLPANDAPAAAEDGAATGELLAGLNTLDAALDLSLGAARRHGQSVRGARLKARLDAGALRVETLEVRDLAGARLAFRGDIADLGSGQPRYDVDYELTTDEAAPVVRLFDPARAPEGTRFGPLRLAGTAKGDAASATLDAEATLAGARATLAGDIGLSADAPVDARLALAAEDPLPVLALAGVTAPRDLGPVHATLTAKGDARSASVTGRARLAGGELSLTGEVTALGTAPAARLSLRLDHPRPTALLDLLGADYRPAAPARLRPLALALKLEADGEHVAVTEGEVKLGASDLAASGSFVFADNEAALIVRAGRLDLDALRPAGATDTANPAPDAPTTAGLPDDVTLRLDLEAARIDWNGGRITALVARGGLDQGAIGIDEIGASLPGGTTLALRGRPTTGAGLEGDVTLDVATPRDLLAWLRVPVPDLPADRLAKLSLEGRLAGSGRTLSVKDLVARLDETTLRGELAGEFAGRPKLSATLALDTLDVDSYLGAATGDGGGGTDGDPLAALAPLAAFDARLALTAGELAIQGRRLAELTLDAVLADGTLALKTFRVARVAGARVALDGEINGLAGTPKARLRYEITAEEGRDVLASFAPLDGLDTLGAISVAGELAVSSADLRATAKGTGAGVTLDVEVGLGLAPDAPARLRADLRLPDPVATAGRFGVALPDDVGPLALKIEGDGTAAAAKLTAALTGLGGTAGFTGDLAEITTAPRLAGDLTVEHPSLKRLLAPWLAGYRTAGAVDPGALALQARLAADPADLRLDIGRATLGDIAFTGAVNMPGESGGPELAIAFDDLDIDAVLALLPEGGGSAPSSGTVSEEALFPADLTAALRVTAKRARWRDAAFHDVALPFAITGGKLALSEGAFGLPGDGQARLNARLGGTRAVPNYRVDWSLEVRDGVPLARLAGLPLDGEARPGAVAFAGTAAGDAAGLALEATATLAGIDAAFAGDLDLDGGGAVDGELKLAASDVGPALALAGLTAPGDLGAADLALRAKGDVKSLALDGELKLAGGSLSLAGDVTALLADPRAALSLTVDHPRPAALLATLGLSYRPAAAKRLAPLKLATRLDVGPGEIAARQFSLRLGASRLAGEAVIKPAPLDIALTVRAKRLDLEALRPSADATSAATDDKTSGAARLPQDITLALDLTAERVDWNGDAVTDLVARAGLAEGALRIDSVQARLPGKTRLDLTGRQLDGGRLQGTVDLASTSPRILLAWAGLAPPKLPPGRLATLAFKGRLAGETGRVAVEDMVAVLDETTLRGRVDATFTGRPNITADLDLDTMNLDAYLGAATPAGGARKAQAPSAPGPALRAALAGLAPLADFDATVTARVGKLRARGARITDVDVAAVLKDGALALDRFRIGALAGARLAASGRIDGLGATPEIALDYDLAADEGADLLAFAAPGTTTGPLGPLALKGSLALTPAGARADGKGRLGDITTSLKAAVGLAADAPVAVEAALAVENAAATAKRFGVDLPAGVGAVDLRLSAVGTARAAKVEARFDGLDGRVGFAGELTGLDAKPRLAGDLELSHPSLKALLAPWVAAYRSKAAADPGALSFASRLDLNLARTRLAAIRASLGKVAVTGNARLRHDGKPHSLKLEFGDVVLEPLLALLPASDGAGKSTSRTSTGPLLPADLGARVTLAAKSIRWRARRFAGLDVRLAIGDGKIEVETARLGLPAKGKASFTGTLDAVDGVAGLTGDLALSTNNLRPLLALAGVKLPKTRKRRFGKTELATRIEARGTDIAARAMTLRLDETTYQGDVGVTLGARTVLVASLGLDRLIVDDYLPKAAPAKPAGKAKPAGDDDPLAGIDARLGLAFGELGYEGRILRDGRATALLEKGRLIIQDLRIGDVGGAVVSLSGSADKLASAPIYDIDFRLEAGDAARLVGWLDPARAKLPAAGALNVQGKLRGDGRSVEVVSVGEVAGAKADVDVRLGLTANAPMHLRLGLDAPDPGRLLTLAGLAAPSGTGPLRLSMTAEGRRESAKVDARIDVAGGVLTAKGTVGGLDAAPTADLRLGLDHPEPVALMQTLGLVAPDAALPPALRHTFDARLRLDAKTLHLDDIALVQGRDRLTGTLTHQLTTTPPRLEARFTTARFDLRPLLLRISVVPDGGFSKSWPPIS